MTATLRPTESAARRPDWRGPESGAQGVRLADGQTWYLPRPRIGVGLQFDAQGQTSLVSRCPDDPDYEHLFDLYFNSDNPVAVIKATLDMAVLLLRRNYELTDEHVAALLVYEPGTADGQAMMTALQRVTTGMDGAAPEEGVPGPKP